MASRKEQKEQARARRIAQEQARAEQARRQRRLRMLGGVVVIAAAIVAVAIAISAGGSGPPPKPDSPAARRAQASVDSLLAGIPQHGNVLGSPKAKVTVTEFGDLECSVCDAFALSPSQTTSAGVPGSGIENQLIARDVRSGKVKLVYRSLETASGSNPDSSAFLNQQTAAEAAGLQNKEWNYVELFYQQQQAEGTAYVTSSFLDGLAREIAGLNYSPWLSHSHDPALQAQVRRDGQFAAARGFNSTPTITFVGPKGGATPIIGLPTSYSQVESKINQVL